MTGAVARRPPAALVDAVFVLMWSSGFVGAALGGEVAAPTTTLTWRFVALVALLWVVSAVLRSRPDAAAWRQQGVIGLLNQVVYLGAVFSAVYVGVSAGLVALIACLQPLVVAVLAGPLLGQRVGRWQVVGLVVGLLGVGLVLGDDVSGSAAPWWGYVLPLLAVAALTTGTLVERRWGTRQPVLQVVLVQASVAAVAFAAAAVATGTLAPPPVTQFWVAVVWLIVFSSIGGYGCYVYVSRTQGALRVSTLIYLSPPTVMVMAYLIFGDSLTWRGLAGLVVCALGVALALVAGRRQGGAEVRRRPDSGPGAPGRA